MNLFLVPDEHVRVVQVILGYQFYNCALLQKALHLPGTTGHDNSDLARIGDGALVLALILEGHGRGATQGKQRGQDLEVHLAPALG